MDKSRKNISRRASADTNHARHKDKILLFSASLEGLTEYGQALRRCGAIFQSTTKTKEVKALLRSGEYTIFMADVTDYDAIGQKMLSWVKSNIGGNILTFGFTRTDLPKILSFVYSRGADQRFYYDHKEMDKLTELVFGLFVNEPNLQWARHIISAQKELKSKIERNPDSLNPVLMQGDKGIGKMALAQIIHGMSDRVNNDFVVADCNPVQRFDYPKPSDEDTEHNRKDIRDNFQYLLGMAYGGTLYIRSFTHLSVLAQDILAEVLKEGKCQIPGRDNLKTFKGRVVLATHHNLSEMVDDGVLSSELYKLITRMTIHIPSLTEYRDEIISIAQYFVNHLCLQAKGRPMIFMSNAKDAIREHPWTGNIVELQEVLEKAVAVAHNQKIGAPDLKLEESQEPEDMSEEDRIKYYLDKYDGNKSAAMKEMGMSRRTFYKRLKIYGLMSEIKSENITME